MNKSDIKILLVDDEPDILEIVGYNLKNEGYEVFTAENGQEAIKSAKKNNPHLILLDIYPLPLALIGLIYSFWSSHVTPVESFFGVVVAGFSLLIPNFISEKMDKHSGIGGGDIKFCLAAGAFVGVLNLHYFFWLAFFFALLLWPVLRAYNKHISFGPALILALWSFMLFKHLL